MHPVLFEILGFPIRSFGVLVAAGFLLGIWIWGRLLAHYGEDPAGDPARASQVSMWLFVGVLGGARLMYVAVESARYLRADVTPAMESYLEAKPGQRATVAQRLGPEHAEELERARQVAVGHDLLHDPIQVLFIWNGGLVMYGGLFGALLLGAWSARRAGLNPWNATDTALVGGFVGQAVGRWGCLLVGDDYGAVVPERFQHLPFPITLHVPSREWLLANPESLFGLDLAGKVLWATQTWMSVNALLVALVAWLVLRRRAWMGQVTAVVLIHYSISRFAIEHFRGDSVRGLWFGGALSTSQLVAIPGVLLGLWLLVKRKGGGPAPQRA